MTGIEPLPQASDEPSVPVNEVPAVAGLRPTAEQRLGEIERLADEAALDRLDGLQESCLLLMEALGGAPPECRAPLLTQLDRWPDLVRAYRRAPLATTGEIIEFLRQPDWQLPLSDEEFKMLEEGLAAATPEATGEPAAAVAAEAPPEADAEVNIDATPAMSHTARQLIDLLMVALATVGAAVDGLAADSAATPEGLEQVRDALERFARASETVGFEGLSQLCGHIGANVQRMQSGRAAFTAQTHALLKGWVARVESFLPNFADNTARQSLLAWSGDRRWPLPLPPEAGAAMLERMRAADAAVGSQPEAPRRVATATAEDVVLALPEDVNRELADVLLQELPIQTQQFSESLQRLRSGGGLADLETAQRVAHTLKGSANTVGIRGIAVLTHHLEDILLACASERKIPGGALLNTLIDAADCLAGMGEALLGLGEPPAEARTVLQDILDWANRIDREGIPATAPAPSPPHRDDTETAPRADTAAPDTAEAAMLRVPTRQIENLFRLSGESIILNSQAQERLRRVKTQLQNLETQFALLQQLGAELEELIDVKDLSGRTHKSLAQGFDALEMDQYNELHTISRRMVEATVDAREMDLDIRREMGHLQEVLDDQQHLVIDAQEAVMQTRLLPIASILPRLQRSVRQTCRLTGKQAELTLSGGNLLIDGDTLSALVDPLMHLLRNAIDHGIETEEEREALRKPRSGLIAFEFEREGNSILARCRDDGRGLDHAAIRQSAEKRGLLLPGQEIGDAELERLILRPSFSTRTQSTQTSGRGVGMDAVQARIAAMGGTVALRSAPAQGLVVELRVPLPLSRSHALLAQTGRYRVAIANKGLAQIFYSGDGEWKELGGKPMLLLDDALYPAVTLEALLHTGGQDHTERPHGAVLLVQDGDAATAVLVEAVTDNRDIVIKNFGHFIPKIPGLIGATVVGDGGVTPVLDIPELLRLSRHSAVAGSAPPDLAEIGAAEPDLPTVLVVDDSLSQRRALEQFLADAGFRVRSVHDGLEAAELLVQFRPDIVLTDLEMPRMNGIELTAHIRATHETRNLPVLMVTSRTTHKHRQMAEQAGIDGYFTKPVRDEELLAAIYGLIASREDRAQQGVGQ